jgi:hypothetical protein
MKLYYYGIQYVHGSDVANSSGYIHRFDRPTWRDKWVAEGSPYVGPGERIAIRATDKLVKRAKEYHQEGLQWPIQVAT